MGGRGGGRRAEGRRSRCDIEVCDEDLGNKVMRYEIMGKSVGVLARITKGYLEKAWKAREGLLWHAENS